MATVQDADCWHLRRLDDNKDSGGGGMGRTASLECLSDEVLLHAFSFLDIPDLLAVSRACRRLRSLSLDPILHAQRLQAASHRLSLSLPLRPSINDIRPPAGTIYLSKTHILARALSRKLITIRLNRNLSQRPSATSLVEHNILPGECVTKDVGTGQVRWGGSMSPSIISVKRQVERERVKDGLRAWLQRKASWREAEHKRSGDGVREPPTVRGLVRKFTARKAAATNNIAARYGDRRVTSNRSSTDAPTRAHVWGLRRFWEGLAKA